MAYLVRDGQPVLSPRALNRRMSLAEQLQAQSLSTEPIESWTQGAARLAQALAGRNIEKRVQRESARGRQQASDRFRQLFDGRKSPQSPRLAMVLGDIDRDTLHRRQRFAESRDDPSAVSPKGALGLMQVMPDTAKSPGFGVKPFDPNDPEANERGGRAYMDAMLNRYGDRETALAAYNWGPGNVDKWVEGGRDPAALPQETRDYIARILGERGAPQPAAQPTRTAQAQPSTQELIELMGDPYLGEGQKAILKAMIEQRFKTTDPTTLQRNMQFLDIDPAQLTPEQRMGLIGKPATTVNVGPQGVDYGDPPKGYAWKRDAEGRVAIDERGAPVPLPIGKEYEREQKAQRAEEDAAADARFVLGDLDRSLYMLGQNPYWLSEWRGAFGEYIQGSPQEQFARSLDAIRANIGFSRLNRMRQNSPTGGALGQVTERELAFLQSVWGSLAISQRPRDMQYNLLRLRNEFQKIIHGQSSDPNGPYYHPDAPPLIDLGPYQYWPDVTADDPPAPLGPLQQKQKIRTDEIRER